MIEKQITMELNATMYTINIKQYEQIIQTIIDWQLTHWGQDMMAAIVQTTYSNAFSRMKIYEFR